MNLSLFRVSLATCLCATCVLGNRVEAARCKCSVSAAPVYASYGSQPPTLVAVTYSHRYEATADNTSAYAKYGWGLVQNPQSTGLPPVSLQYTRSYSDFSNSDWVGPNVGGGIGSFFQNEIRVYVGNTSVAHEYGHGYLGAPGG
jgi:hypothetical protein